MLLRKAEAKIGGSNWCATKYRFSASCFLSYTVLDMEEEAIITEVRPGTQRSLGEGLDINFLQVRFRVLRRSRYRDRGYKVTLKSPAWLSQLEPSAPLNGYLMEHGEFSAELIKDERINEDLKVTVEVTDV